MYSLYKSLPRFYISDMVKDSSVTSLDTQMEADYRQDVISMKSELMKAKAFESSKLYYAFKVTSNAAILASAVAAIVLLNGMSGAVICGVLMALFWQQCGWLAHDFLHYQVFTNRMYNNLAGLCIGNIWQSFSTACWKTKNNHHHASPDVVHTEAGGYPDKSTMPLLLWSEKIIEGDLEDLKDLPRFMVRHQKPVLLPSTDGLYSNIMAAAVTSLSTGPVHKYVGGLPMKIAEISTFALHYAAVVYITTLLETAALRIFFHLICHSLAVVFTSGQRFL